MEDFSFWVYILVPVAAFLFASVGQGGGSGYLAILTLFGVSLQITRPTVFVLNVLVAFLSFSYFFKKVDIPRKLILLLIISSVPFVIIGANFNVSQGIAKTILSLVLMVGAFRLLFLDNKIGKEKIQINFFIVPMIGSSIGFIAGLTGIGGGMLLSTILVLLGWTDFRQTAVITTIFIMFNSIAGLITQGTAAMQVWNSNVLLLVLCTFSGAALGGYLGANRFKSQLLKQLLSLMILSVCVLVIFSK